MRQRVLLEVKTKARSAGYHDVKVIGKWNGYEVAEPIFSDGKIRYIGIPQFILVKGTEIRWTVDDEESVSIMKTL